MAEEKDLYAVLGVSKGASADELRRSYRRLARKYHPDVNPGDKQAEERFKEVSAAYDVLSDTDKRKLYDEFGMAGLREGFDPEKARAYQSWSRGRAATGFGGGEPGFDFDFDVGDIFGDVFGGQQRRRAGEPRRGHGGDLLAVVEIDLAQAIRGSEVQLQVPAAKTCEACQGSGNELGSKERTCPECGGSGRRQVVRGPMRMSAVCPTCGGAGVLRTPCHSCGGSGKQVEQQTVTVRIPPGADDGSRLRVPKRGEPGVGGGPPGDLVIETRVRPHPHFRRQGLDLYLRLPVSLAEAYNGATVEVPTPTGTVKLKIPPRSQQGSEMRLRNKGVARGGQAGDLYVTLDVRVPEVDDEEVRHAVEAASRGYRRPLREGIAL